MSYYKSKEFVDRLATEILTEKDEKKKLAIILHAYTCQANHTDGCGWYYYKDKFWENYEPKCYLDKAKRILKVVDYLTAVKVIEALKIDE